MRKNNGTRLQGDIKYHNHINETLSVNSVFGLNAEFLLFDLIL